uniref:DUF4923 domain-containing protein n=1 Tax=Prevotella sp. GTC17254 TaxID=3236794 RepID=A0AB33IZ56_9BACT
MKKITILSMALAAMTLTASAAPPQFDKILSKVKSAAGSSTTGDAAGNILSNVLGTDKPSENDLAGTWKYNQPGVAFTSKNVLAKAGGQVAASTVKTKLKSSFSKVGLQGSNTQFTFNQDKTFSGKLRGKSLKGTYTYDPSTAKLTLKTALVSIPCYVQKSTSGLSLLFESTKLLKLFQTGAQLSGNSSLKTISALSKNYDGMRMGFDLKK